MYRINRAFCARLSRRRFFRSVFFFYWLLTVLFAVAIRAQEPGKALRVGFTDFAPFTYLDERKSPSGLAVDVLNQVAAEEGWTVEYRYSSWSECQRRLAAGELDLLPAAARTPDREERFLFGSEPVGIDWCRVYAHPEVVVESLLDLNQKRIAVLKGDYWNSGPSGIRRLCGRFGIESEFVEFAAYTQALQAAADGRVDAAVVSEMYGNMNAGAYAVRRTPVVFSPEPLYVMAHRDAGLEPVLTRIDLRLRELKSDSNSLYYRALSRHLGTAGGSEAVYRRHLWMIGLSAGVVVLLLLGAIRYFYYLLNRRTRDLRESEERFRIIADYTVGLEFWVSRDGELLWVNPGVHEFTGLTPQQFHHVFKEDPLARIWPDDREMMREFFRAAADNPAQPPKRFRIRHADGHEIWTEARLKAAADGQGRDMGCRWSFRDITLQVMAEKTLRAQEEFLRHVFDLVPHMLFAKDCAGHFFMVNKAMADLHGTTPDRMIGKTDADFQDRSGEERLRKVREMDLRVMNSGRREIEPELEFIDQRGVRHVHRIIKMPMKVPGTHEPGILGIAVDITDLKKAQERVQEEHALLQTIINTLPDHVFVKDENLNILLCNQATVAAHGFKTPEAMRGKTDLDYLPPEKAARYMYIERQVLEGRSFPALEESYFDAEGTEHTFLTSKIPLRDLHGRVTGLVGIARDITQRAAMQRRLKEAKERAEQADRAKSAFLAHMSHEIRTPLNAVIGLTDLLLDCAVTSDQRDYAETIKSSGEALLAIINDILDLSKIEAGQMELESEPFDPRLCVNEVLHMMAGRAVVKGLGLSTETGESVPARILGDRFRLRQVLLNLVGNAVKFTEEGEICIRVAAEPVGPLRCRMIFRVEDSGIGISPDKLEKVFEPFQQADSATTRRYGGTGLGLPICRKIVEKMNGRIEVESEPGRGSMFKVMFEAEIPESPRVPVEPAAVDTSFISPSLKNLRILLAEDNRVNQKVAMKLLDRLGCQAELAENGRQALERFEVADFNLILMDVQMPEMDGLEATRLIRSGQCPQPWIVGVTAHALEEDRKACMEAGMNDFLTKPVRLADLRQVLLRAAAEVGADDAAI